MKLKIKINIKQDVRAHHTPSRTSTSSRVNS